MDFWTFGGPFLLPTSSTGTLGDTGLAACFLSTSATVLGANTSLRTCSKSLPKTFFPLITSTSLEPVPHHGSNTVWRRPLVPDSRKADAKTGHCTYFSLNKCSTKVSFLLSHSLFNLDSSGDLLHWSLKDLDLKYLLDVALAS